MMRMLRQAVAANLIASVVAVFALTSFGLFQGQPMADEWMGLRRDLAGFPSWVDILIGQSILLWVFCMRRRTEEWKVRLFIAGAGAAGLAFSLVLPLLLPHLPDLLAAPRWSPDRLVFWYACVSDLAYGVVGTTTPEEMTQKEAERFAELSNSPSPAKAPGGQNAAE
jgi:hypothetical protein